MLQLSAHQPLRRRARRAVTGLAAAALAVALASLPASAATKPSGPGADLAQHSLRAAVTDENFYFVMADRFENGDPGNDLGGLPPDRMISGFDPTNKGFYNGGDLKGLLNRIDYVR